MYALDTPTHMATKVDSAMVTKPTVTETRAPYTTRLHTSRERLSVPIQKCAPRSDTPTHMATKVDSAMVTKPTVTETRAPYTTRLHTSRERLSVPIQKCAPGGFMRAPGMLSS